MQSLSQCPVQIDESHEIISGSNASRSSSRWMLKVSLNVILKNESTDKLQGISYLLICWVGETHASLNVGII